MFGYITANTDTLTEEELRIYRETYCGLCHELRQRYGKASRLTLTYDMTFLILVLSSLYLPENTSGRERCMLHPCRKHGYMVNMFTGYAADMNILLTYNKLIDDWKDERSPVALAGSKLFERRWIKEIRQKYPRQAEITEDCLAELAEIEKKGVLNPDAPANAFGRLMAEIFIAKEDEYSDGLRSSMCALGKFIYIMDAWDDLTEDIKKENYNPLTRVSLENIEPILTMLISECADKLFALPLKENIGLLRNIILSGVWIKYSRKKKNSLRE